MDKKQKMNEFLDWYQKRVKAIHVISNDEFEKILKIW